MSSSLQSLFAMRHTFTADAFSKTEYDSKANCTENSVFHAEEGDNKTCNKSLIHIPATLQYILNIQRDTKLEGTIL